MSAQSLRGRLRVLRSPAQLLVALVALLAPGPARADVAVTWMAVADRALEKVEEQDPRWRTAANTRPTAQLALAMFEAANAVEGRYRSYLGTPAAAAGTSGDVAVASAAHSVLVTLFPGEKAMFDDALVVSLAGLPAGQGKEQGIELGKRVAAAAIARSSPPAGRALEPYRPATTPGAYIDAGLPSIQPFDLVMRPYRGGPPRAVGLHAAGRGPLTRPRIGDRCGTILDGDSRCD